MPPLCVLLVDDSPDFLSATLVILASAANIYVAGCASSGASALEQVLNLAPDVVLMDVNMPGMSGLEATAQIKARPHAPRVIILTLHDGPEYRAAATAARADGFISKSEIGAELLPLLAQLFPAHAAPVACSPHYLSTC